MAEGFADIEKLYQVRFSPAEQMSRSGSGAPVR